MPRPRIQPIIFIDKKKEMFVHLLPCDPGEYCELPDWDTQEYLLYDYDLRTGVGSAIPVSFSETKERYPCYHVSERTMIRMAASTLIVLTSRADLDVPRLRYWLSLRANDEYCQILNRDAF